jgi:hypothetical protein
MRRDRRRIDVGCRADTRDGGSDSGGALALEALLGGLDRAVRPAIVAPLTNTLERDGCDAESLGGLRCSVSEHGGSLSVIGALCGMQLGAILTSSWRMLEYCRRVATEKSYTRRLFRLSFSRRRRGSCRLCTVIVAAAE